jgi:hypothetical protein
MISFTFRFLTYLEIGCFGSPPIALYGQCVGIVVLDKGFYLLVSSPFAPIWILADQFSQKLSHIANFIAAALNSTEPSFSFFTFLPSWSYALIFGAFSPLNVYLLHYRIYSFLAYAFWKLLEWYRLVRNHCLQPTNFWLFCFSRSLEYPLVQIGCLE